jgi:carbamoyltransferase
VHVLGLNAHHGDASAALVADEGFVAGVEEERFTRVKHWAGFPEQAIRYCLEQARERGAEQELEIAVSRQPKAYLARKAALALRHPRSLGRALRRAKNLATISRLDQRLEEASDGLLSSRKIYPVEHHLAHVASAFFCSPWEEAMCLTVDGFGDFVSTMMAVGRGNKIDVIERVLFPHSLGQLYTAVTQYLGFPNFGDEYKVMGLAAYGEPTLVDKLRRVVPERHDGTFALDLRYFRHLREGVDMTWYDGEPRLGAVFSEELEALLGPARVGDADLTQRHKDIAASLQAVYEERFFSLVRELQRRTGLKRLCLAGGCGMNSVANGKLFDNSDIEEVYIQSASGDAGTALGAALYVQHAIFGAKRSSSMEHSYWGPEYSEAEIREAIAFAVPESHGRDGVFGGISIRRYGDEGELIDDTATAIASGEVVGWYQGRSEWGPRALGNRSILADPRRADMRDLLNRKIKRRESFRPFAPSVLEERTGDWFTVDYPDPFMLKVYPVRTEKRDRIPAVTHVDGTGRLQTVSERGNRLYWNLIRSFEELSGVPMLLNTSFNENEPIVNTPTEALDCFLRTKMDRLVIGNCVLISNREA